MRHADEGTLHELIDGSLAPAEARRIEAHLAACGACRARFAEARALVQETAGLIVALDTPVAAAAAPPAATPRRRLRYTIVGWAASVAAAVGIGFALHPPAGPIPASARDETPPARAAGNAVAKAAPLPSPGSPPEEARRRRPAGGTDRTAVSSTDRPDADAPAPARSRAAVTPPEVLRVRQPAVVALDAAPSRNAGPSDARAITLEEAVQRLGGSIRLIDGLDPVSVTRVPGTSVDGADPRREAVLVRYLDPTFGAIELAQQRILTADSLEASAPSATGVIVPRARKAAPESSRSALAAVSWKDGHGFQMTLTAAAPAESLAALRARVR